MRRREVGVADHHLVPGRIGFDEITVGAKPGESSQQAQITLGKYLSPRLFISYGVGLFQAGQSFRLQYDIGSGFKLATETGVESGGDLLYTIER
jgi:translocation and assembly module TamB